MNGRISALDSSRGLASLIVVVYHVPIVLGRSVLPSSDNSTLQVALDILWLPSRLGEQAVYFFMCLSGFVLTEFAFRLSSSFTKWVRWRLLRLEPIYYSSLLFALVLIPNAKPGGVRFADLVQTYILSDDKIYSGLVPPLWSLTVEFIISILLFKLIRSRRGFSKKALVFLAVGYLCSYLVPGWGLRALIRSAILFTLGSEISRLLRDTQRIKISKPLFCFVFCICLTSLVNPRITTLLQVVGIPALVVAVAWTNSKLLNNRTTIFFGKISFSLYATHWITLVWLRENFIHDSTQVFLVWAATIPSCILVAVVFWALIEKPTQALAKKSVRNP
jgi:peptidoglycan/LPS O-acetylase OafA/YrhL